MNVKHVRWGMIVLLALLALPAGCSNKIGRATLEDKSEYAFWIDQVPAKRRDKILLTASQHTDWSEKRKFTWCTDEFKHLVLDEQRAARKAASKPTSQPHAGP